MQKCQKKKKVLACFSTCFTSNIIAKKKNKKKTNTDLNVEWRLKLWIEAKS